MKIDKEVAGQALAEPTTWYEKMDKADYAVLELLEPMIERAVEQVIRKLFENKDESADELGARYLAQIHSQMLSVAVNAWYAAVVAAERQIEKDKERVN